MAEYIKQLQPFGSKWRLVKKIGAGSYGTVWKAVCKDDENPKCTAIKEILVPTSEACFREAKLEGLNREGANFYFKKVLEKTEKEVFLMEKLSLCPNIVRFYEVQICNLEKTGGFGWALYIRMELLSPLKERLLEKNITVCDTVKLMIDICHALEICEENGIVHQDIKPDNLFYDPVSDIYKLGDFGIAQELGRATAQKGRPGTLSYMSPEVFQGGKASPQLDLYALGMILYRLMNHFRIPFLPDYPAHFSPEERDKALLGRLRGWELEEPQIVREKGIPQGNLPGVLVKKEEAELAVLLGQAARKCIAANPSDRFKNAKEFREEIQKIKNCILDTEVVYS